MSYEQFICAMQECISKKLSGNVSVERQEILKNNGVKNVGLVVHRKEERIAPLIYLEDFYTKYQKGASVDALAEYLIRCSEAAPGAPAWDYHQILDFCKIRNRVIYRLVNAKENAQLLKEIPHLPFLDLAIIFYVMVPTDGEADCAILIRNTHMAHWGLPISLLYEAARKNTPELCPCRIRALDELLADVTGTRLIILTNERGQSGATVILYAGVPEKLYQRIGANYYLIPSSVHEFIIVPDDGQIGGGELLKMLLEINETEVAPEEVLSDHIYYFNGDIMTQM